MKRILSGVILLCGLATAVAQERPADPREDENAYAGFLKNVQKLFDSVRELDDWDTHYALMMDSMEKVFERNEWDSESDAFALSLIGEVNTVPPWQPQDRFEKAMEILSDRYLLDERQEQVLRQTVIRESSGIFMRHSGRIVQYAVDAIQTRAAGEPFTPEQVANWVRLARPVFDDARQRMNVVGKELESELDEDQRALLRADLAAANRRMNDMYRMSQRWERGEWTADDWGMEEDPIQLSGTVPPEPDGDQPADSRERTVTRRPRPAVNPRPPVASDGEPSERPEDAVVGGDRPQQTLVTPVEDNSPWAQYVRDFIRRYQLDESQQSRAWKIYRDVKTRGENYRKRFGERIESARRRAATAADEAAQARVRAAEAEQKTALDRLFEQLKRRLDRLPTRAQRRNAKPLPPERPTTAPTPRAKTTDGP